eukprot:gene32251-40831_t
MEASARSPVVYSEPTRSPGGYSEPVDLFDEESEEDSLR